jgi:hypothetical protein
LTSIADYSDAIHDGLDILAVLGPQAEVISSAIGFIFDIVVGMDQKDPTAEIIDAINDLGQKIETHLDYLNEEIKKIGLDILNEILSGIYTQGFGKDLDNLYTQLKSMTTLFNKINASKIYTENEKLVETAYLIGNDADWLKEGNMMFNLKKLAEVISGNTFVEVAKRDLFKVIYDENVQHTYFSGEAYDQSEPYIEKVMQVYFYGCSAILYCLQNALFVSNFTKNEIEALSPLAQNHYYECAIQDPELIEAQFEFLANAVYNITSNASVITHYTAYKFKKKHERNVFVDAGSSAPIPIADKVNYKVFEYEGKSYEERYFCAPGYCPWEEQITDVWIPFLAELRWDVQGFGDISAISPKQMDNLLKYLQNNKIFTNSSELFSFFKDKNIDSRGELAEEIKSAGIVHLPLFNYNTRESTCHWESFEYVGMKAISAGFFSADIVDDGKGGYHLDRRTYDLYHVDIECDILFLYYQLIVDGVPTPQKLFSFNRAKELVIPQTAKEIMELENSTNITNYNNQIINTKDTFKNTNINNYDNNRVIFLGFNDFCSNYSKDSKNIPFFNMYFTTLDKKFISNFMYIPINIKYKNSLRNLENENYNYSQTVCFITKEYKKSRASCLILDKNIENINSIEIIPNISFSKDKNVTLSFSPIANKQKNNIIGIDNKNYSNYTLYTLENSSFVEDGKSSFNVSGIIKDFSNNYTYNSFIFTFNNNNDDSSSEVKCKFVNINRTIDNYTLNCESNPNLNANLDSGISINEEQKIILLITFNNPNGTDSQIKPEGSGSTYKRYFKKSNGKLGAGSIALIIIIPILVVIAVITTIFLTKKSGKIPEKYIEEGNTISSVTINKIK